MLECWGAVAAMRSWQAVVGAQEVWDGRWWAKRDVFVGRLHRHVLFPPQGVERSTAFPVGHFGGHDHGVDGLAW